MLLKKLTLLASVCMLLFHTNVSAQTSFQLDPTVKSKVEEYHEYLQRDDYASMRKMLKWYLRLFIKEDVLRNVYGEKRAMFGVPTLHAIDPRGERAVIAKVKYSADTTETFDMSYSFSKRGKIVGLFTTEDHFVFKKDSALRPLDIRLGAVDSLLSLKDKNTNFNGSVMVIEGGKVVYTRHIGEADFDAKVPLNDKTMFELASCSKQFTGMAILMLAEQGKIALGDPITKYLPELPYNEVTIDHLLHHTSGLPDYMSLLKRTWDKTKIASNEDMIAAFAQAKPKVYFKPGEKHFYSNTGYAMLASIIERVSGMSYADFMQKSIFSPLGMSRTRVYNTRRSGERIDNYALGYTLQPETKQFVLPDSLKDHNYVYYLDGITGDGTVNTCIADLSKWEEALRKNTLVSAEMMRYAMSEAKLNDGKKVKYGCGWELELNEKYERVAHHGGSWPGYLNYAVHYLDRERSVVVLSNNEYYFVPRLAKKICAIMGK